MAFNKTFTASVGPADGIKYSAQANARFNIGALNAANNGWIPEKGQAAIASACSEQSGCDDGGLIGLPEFNSASISGAFHCQSRRRSFAIAA